MLSKILSLRNFLFITGLLLCFNICKAQVNAAFTAQVGCNGYVTLNALQQTYTTYNWAFGDNSTGTGASVVHQYVQGFYTVTLSLWNGTDSNTTSQQVYVGEYIQQQLSGAADVCTGTSATYTLTNPSANLQYTWLVSGANMVGNSHADHVQLTFNTPGSAVLSVIISNGAGCDSILHQNIAVHPVPVLILPGQANDSSQVQFTICQNTPIWYHVLSSTAGNIIWSSGSGIALSAQGVDSMLFTFPNAGSTSLQVAEVTPWGCTDTINAIVIVTSSPSVTATATNACLGTDNYFAINPPNGPLTYIWNFDDGTHATGGDPTHTFTTTGPHTAQVIATNQNGCRDTATATAQVDANPGPPVVCVGPVCSGDKEVYSTTVVAGVSYHWTITGGTITAGGTLTDNTVGVQWGNSAMGTVQLYLTGPGIYCQFPTVEQVPIIGGTLAIQGSLTPCIYTNVTYTTDVIPGGIYNWTVVGGYIQGGQGTNQIQASFDNPITCTISVNITHEILTCTSNATLSVTPLYPFSVYAPVIACTGIATSINTYQAGNFNWTVQGGSIISGNGTGTISALWSNAGTYTVKASISSGFCNTDASAIVTVVARKVETVQGNNKTCINSNETYFISPDEATYAWTVSGGGVITGANSNSISVAWNAAGNHRLQVIYSDPNYCLDTAVYTVTVAPEDVPPITGDTVSCFGGVITYSFTPVAGVDYTWETEGGVITAGQNTSAVTVMWTGNQIGLLRLRNSVCNTFRQVNIVIRPIPAVHIEFLNLTCDGSSVDFKVVEDYPGYSWSTAATTQSIHITTPGSYNVTITDSKGCTATGTQNANPIPNDGFASLYINVIVPSNPSPYAYLQLQAMSYPVATSYLWSTGNVEQSEYVNVAGTYSVTVTNQYGCTGVISAVVTTSSGNCHCNGGTCNGGGRVILPCPGLSPVFTTNNPVCNPVQFTPGAVATYYLWDFGDGVYSSLSNPTHRFNTPGTKNVIMYYSNDGINWYDCNQNLTINSIMHINYTVAGGCKGAVVLTNTSASALPVTSVLWELGDGNTAISSPVLNYLYPNSASSYIVSLILNDGTCTDSLRGPISVNQLKANFVYADACKDNPVLFNDATMHSSLISSYNWVFGNGETADYPNPVTYYHAAGNYTGSLTIKDADDCIDTYTQTIAVNQFGPLAVTASGPLTFCKGSWVDLTIPAGYRCYWNTGDTSNTIHVTQSGNFFAWVKDIVSGCSGFTDTVAVIENIPPRAFISYQAEKTELCQGAHLDLEPMPSTGVTYQWYQYNNVISTSPSLYNWYVTSAQTGDYQLIIKDANGCYDTSSVLHINVNPLPAKPFITVNPSGNICDGQSVNLSVTGSDLFQWNNGVIGNNTTVYQSGVYEVVATNNFGCTSYNTAYVNFAAIPDFRYFLKGCYQICQSSNISVSGPAGMQTYLWSDGETTQTITLSTSGTYSLSATATDGCSSQSGSFTVDVFGSGAIELGNDTVICAGQHLLLDAGAYPQVIWQDNSTNQTFTVTDSGLYYVQVITSNGCKSSDSIHVNVDAVVVELGNDTALCSGSSFVLSTGGSFTSSIWQDGSTASALTVNQAGLYFVNVTDQNGCKAGDSINISIHSVAIELGNDTVLCNNSALVLSVGGNFVSTVWQDGSAGVSYEVLQAGLYIVSVTDAFGCTASDSIKVDFHTVSVELGNDTTICSGSSLQLSVAGNFANIIWRNGLPGSSQEVTQPGLYIVTVTDAFGCTASDSITVSHFPVAEPDSIPNQYLCDSSVTLAPRARYSSYLWNTGATTQSITVSQLGSYHLTMTDQNGCSSSDSCVVLSCDTNSCNGNYFIPNVFTPNNDGKNDEFRVFRKPNTVPTNYFLISIYDRWGEKVFEGSDENTAWEGKYKGADAVPGVYIYMVKYVCQEHSIAVHGAVTLLR